jgi:uncharacterized membrane protein YdjX (TVP38/TMEM64 family)
MSGRSKTISALTLLVFLVAAAMLLPIPSPAALRSWASGHGPATTVLFLLAYSVLTVAPIPRTVFNLAAGLLLGDVAGILVAMVATTAASGLAFGLARVLGRDLVSRHLHRTSVRAVNQRLSGGGVLAITSLRLIPVVPFAPLNYCCGVSSIRLWPYLLGTALGSIPGTVSIVVLGDALTGNTPPALLGCYAIFTILGMIGLLRVTRRRLPVATDPERTAATPAS